MRHRVNKAPLNRITPLQKGASPGAHAHPLPDQDRTVSSKDRQSSALVPVHAEGGGAAGCQHTPSAVPDPNSPTTAEADPLGTARPHALPAPDQNTTGTISLPSLRRHQSRLTASTLPPGRGKVVLRSPLRRGSRMMHRIRRRGHRRSGAWPSAFGPPHRPVSVLSHLYRAHHGGADQGRARRPPLSTQRGNGEAVGVASHDEDSSKPCRGRKRRRYDEVPSGRADGMAIDAPA
ncbi:hypothetical protein ZWY2020_003440 [Hordeum vulgare]|nr:hypothetical protein ZWY2020_003440 [Hordeum vulgare]